MAAVQDKPSKSPRFVVIAIVLLSVLFAVGLGALIFIMVRPRGDRVGETSLTDPKAVLVVNGNAGDALVFRTDASIGIPRISLVSDDQIEIQASSQLSRSTLTVKATAPSGSEFTSTCPLYKGRAQSTSSTPGAFSRSGMLNDCMIALSEGGAWKIRASVAWHRDLTLHSASLETRLEAAVR